MHVPMYTHPGVFFFPLVNTGNKHKSLYLIISSGSIFTLKRLSITDFFPGYIYSLAKAIMRNLERDNS